MALTVELKPGERMIVGDSVITNGDQRARLMIEGSSPILRERDIMTAGAATSPARRIYLALQLMYTAREPRQHHEVYFRLINELVQAVPSTWPHVEAINNAILMGQMYKALKEAAKLIAYEERLTEHAPPVASVSGRRTANCEPA
jgi:flagellar protein FlbT